ncbi:phage portal protein [Mycobacterium palustre]|uniref:phage portal protein n=1 Tax=Mycobacterium palustre TaxID=153971 RepID=UPI00114DADA4|nr:phage portal protein [Mycobacterium palustre]MCV7100074.1 phage portal protein [Mycobacterium palustre]
MNLLERMLGRGRRDISTIDDYISLWNQFTYNGVGYGLGYAGTNGIIQTLGGQETELAPNNFVGLGAAAYQANGVVFACMLVRQLVFSTIRFQWQQIRQGKPSELFGTPDLAILETPWTGGTTQDLLSRTINDADLAGNSYWYKDTPLARLGTNDPNTELVRMRPDWVDIVVEPRMVRGGGNEVGGGQLGWRKLGYVYTERGTGDGEPVGFLADEVAHFHPIVDPFANFRGMSWLTPILREIQADQAMTRHQRKFFDNGASPNMVIKHVAGATEEKVKHWLEEFKEEYTGVENAYKALNLYPGADVTVVGSNLRQIDFKQVRGGGETRIAAAAGVPPVIVGLSEGLAAATYSNYGQARRRFADGTAHPLWQNMSGSMAQIVKPPRPDVRLWYDTTDVPFLREDESDAAEIQSTRAATINTLITAGYIPDSVVAAVEANDFGLLKHSGMYSVQLQQPTGQAPDLKPVLVTDSQQGGSTNGATPTQ